MPSVQLHAINGSMIVSSQGLEKLLKIRKEREADATIFVIAPVCNGNLELNSLLELARIRDERLWGQMESKKESWITLIESLVVKDHRSTAIEKINQGFKIGRA